MAEQSGFISEERHARVSDDVCAILGSKHFRRRIYQPRLHKDIIAIIRIVFAEVGFNELMASGMDPITIMKNAQTLLGPDAINRDTLRKLAHYYLSNDEALLSANEIAWLAKQINLRVSNHLAGQSIIKHAELLTSNPNFHLVRDIENPGAYITALRAAGNKEKTSEVVALFEDYTHGKSLDRPSMIDPASYMRQTIQLGMPELAQHFADQMMATLQRKPELYLDIEDPAAVIHELIQMDRTVIASKFGRDLVNAYGTFPEILLASDPSILVTQLDKLGLHDDARTVIQWHVSILRANQYFTHNVLAPDTYLRQMNAHGLIVAAKIFAATYREQRETAPEMFAGARDSIEVERFNELGSIEGSRRFIDPDSYLEITPLNLDATFHKLGVGGMG